MSITKITSVPSCAGFCGWFTNAITAEIMARL